MKQNETLPLYGVGPIYVYIVLILDIVGIVLSQLGILPKVSIAALRIPLIIIGIALIVLNVIGWIKAAILSKLDSHIQKNELVTNGIYAYMRNPIYSAITFALFGVLLIYGNLVLLPLLFVDWIFLTILMKNTEEKWLLNLYGEEYKAYCKKVNRFFPWVRGNRG